MKIRFCALTLAIAVTATLIALVGCNPSKPSADTKGGAAATKSSALQLWHTQTQDNEKALKEIVDAYNAQPGVTPVEATYIGNYDQIFEKVRAGLQGASAGATAGTLPDFAVAYESMVSDYMAANAVQPLDTFFNDPKDGFTKDEQADFFPAYLEMNKFSQFNNQMLSFPFTKSVLLMYANTSLLDEVGLKVPTTWDELYKACTAIAAKHPGMKPFSFFKDASAWDAIMLSFGGKLLEADGTAGFNEPATQEAYAFFAKMVKDKLIAEPTDKATQNSDFGQGKCAFFLRSSTARPDITKLVGNQFKWDVACLPSKDGVKPVTVLFGANICMFKSTPEREKAAWQFMKYFSSPEVTAKWAIASGYLPVRKSALETQTAKTYLAQAEQNKKPFDILPSAVPEPNVAGWQDVRKALEKAHMDVINGLATPDKIAAELDKTADAALAKAKQGGAASK